MDVSQHRVPPSNRNFIKNRPSDWGGGPMLWHAQIPFPRMKLWNTWVFMETPTRQHVWKVLSTCTCVKVEGKAEAWRFVRGKKGHRTMYWWPSIESPRATPQWMPQVPRMSSAELLFLISVRFLGHPMLNRHFEVQNQIQHLSKQPCREWKLYSTRILAN